MSSTSRMNTISTRMAEMLFSKMTHDLVGPAGATENGLELLEEETGAMASEAMELVKQSASMVSSRMRLYRLAFGTAAGSVGLDAHAIQQTITAFFKFEEKYTIRFGAMEGGLAAESKKLLFNLVLCAGSALPYGGTVHIAWDNGIMTLTATSSRTEKPTKENACIVYTPETVEPDDISPYTVQAWYAGHYAMQQKCNLKVQNIAPHILEITASGSAA